MRKITLAAAIAAITLAVPASADVKKGVAAWSKGEWSKAVKEWTGPAAEGDPDAQFNLGQAYKLGRGVEYDGERARAWYLRAAQQGHEQAQDNYGISLYQEGRKAEAVKWLEKSVARDEKRAQLVLGTMLYNGDDVTRDWPRAYALVSRSAAQGMEQAVVAKAKMDNFLTTDDRRAGSELARLEPAAWATAMEERATRTATTASPAPSTPSFKAPSGSSNALASAGTRQGTPLSRGDATRFSRPWTAPVAAAPTLVASTSAPLRSDGSWRVQLGAFRERSTAVSLWSRLGPAFEGGRPVYGEFAGLTRLQVAGFDSKSQATQACGQLAYRGLPCFVVRP